MNIEDETSCVSAVCTTPAASANAVQHGDGHVVRRRLSKKSQAGVESPSSHAEVEVPQKVLDLFDFMDRFIQAAEAIFNNSSRPGWTVSTSDCCMEVVTLGH